MYCFASLHLANQIHKVQHVFVIVLLISFISSAGKRITVASPTVVNSMVVTRIASFSSLVKF